METLGLHDVVDIGSSVHLLTLAPYGSFAKYHLFPLFGYLSNQVVSYKIKGVHLV